MTNEHIRVACWLSACLLLSSHPASAEQTYQTRHFRIVSPLDPRFVRAIELNAEAYYDGMTPRYFPQGFDQPLVIYYAKTQADTRRALRGTGVGDVGYGLYLGTVPTLFGGQPVLYTHRIMDGGGLSLWGTLFHEITHHFIQLNYGRCPAWFNEGLASFLGERTRIVKHTLTIGRANPWREQILRDLIDRGLQVDVNRLVSFSDEEFYRAKEGYHVSRAVFFWLYTHGKLDEYLSAVKEQGFGLSTLETVTSRSAEEINRALLDFIKKRCYPAAFLADADSTTDRVRKTAAYHRALGIQPDFQPALVEWAKVLHDEREFKQCRETVESVLRDPQSADYVDAAWVAGNCDYMQQRYPEALREYQLAADAAQYREDQYQLYYWIASCYHDLGNVVAAKEWYQKFLDNDWEPEDHPEWTSVARSHL